MVVNTEKAIQIVDAYGADHQKYKAAEELSELMTVVLQDANLNGKVPLNNIVEEIADVYVMLKQLEVIYMVDDRDIQPIIEYKMDRALARRRRNEEWEENAKKTTTQKIRTPELDEQWNVLPSE